LHLVLIWFYYIVALLFLDNYSIIDNLEFSIERDLCSVANLEVSSWRVCSMELVDKERQKWLWPRMASNHLSWKLSACMTRNTVDGDPRWCCTYLLDPTDPLFVEIGKAFILQQIEGIWWLFYYHSKDYEYTHSSCVCFGLAGTDVMCTFKCYCGAFYAISLIHIVCRPSQRFLIIRIWLSVASLNWVWMFQRGWFHIGTSKQSACALTCAWYILCRIWWNPARL
jgi:hypothetical protein